MDLDLSALAQTLTFIKQLDLNVGKSLLGGIWCPFSAEKNANRWHKVWRANGPGQILDKAKSAMSANEAVAALKRHLQQECDLCWAADQIFYV